MALANGDINAEDIEVAKILLQLHGNFQQPLKLTINQNTSPMKPLTNKSNNMNVLKVTSRPNTSTPKGSENVPLQNGFKKDDMYDNTELNSLPPKKRLNIYKRYLLEQKRWAKERSLLAERALYKSRKVQTRDVATQTEEEYIPPTKSEDIKALYKRTKMADCACIGTSPVRSDPDEVERVPERERESTSSNEAPPRVRYQRNAKANNIFCNGTKKAHIKEERDTENDSDYKAEREKDHEYIEQKVEDEESEESVMEDKSTPQINETEEMVPIGIGNARVPSRVLKNVDWNGSYTTATRKLLTALFPRSILATHSLTGKQSPAFPNKAAKRKLDPLLVDDIVRTVADRCNVKEALVRTSITTKCADESKMLRNRLQNKKKYRKVSTCSS